MNDVLRDIVIGLGILLGVMRAEDPQLSMRVFRNERAISINMEVAHAFPKDAQGLLESGNDLTLIFTIEAGGYGLRKFTHTIGFDPITLAYRITLEETNMRHVTKDREAALDIASKVFGYTLLDLSEYDATRALEIRASCALEVPGLEAGVLWNFKNPQAARSFSALTEIPR